MNFYKFRFMLAVVIFMTISACRRNVNVENDRGAKSAMRTDALSAPNHEFSLASGTSYNAGAGSADITGPAAGLGTLGYAAPLPLTNGIKQRLKARAFVLTTDTDLKPMAIVVLDTGFISIAIRSKVMEQLRAKFGDLFEESRVILTATHTHSAPGAYSNNPYYNIPFAGVSRQNLQIIVSGTVNAIAKALSNLRPSRVVFNDGSILNGNINRSLFAYLENPVEERQRWATTTDETVQQLSFETLDGKPYGLINWYAVHGTSVEKDNGLINGDNKGFAAALVERQMGGDFVAAFAPKSSGDVSPNVARDVDNDGDWDCQANENFRCAEESGRLQAEKALELLYAKGTDVKPALTGSIVYVDFSAQIVKPPFNGNAGGRNEATTSSAAKTCVSAIGAAMLAGSEEDGPGVGKEGITCSGSPLLALRCRQFPCQGEKVVALATGSWKRPLISPILPLQLVRIGQFAILGAPGELTTMAGRRLEDTVSKELADQGNTKVIVMAYANDYAGYTTTPEEYQVQHYEGGHTVFGEWQLGAMQQAYWRLARELVEGRSGIASWTTNSPQIIVDDAKTARQKNGDDSPGDSDFGSVVAGPKRIYYHGELAKVSFVGANPNNDMHQDGSFLEIQRANIDADRFYTLEEVTSLKSWAAFATDHDWETAFRWQDRGRNRSLVQIEWEIADHVPAGWYRVVYRGDALAKGVKSPFVGTSPVFEVRETLRHGSAKLNRKLLTF